jgi:D-alanyl-D-alanine carboxypeptidase
MTPPETTAPSWAGAAGGVISTAGDLAAWIEGLVGGRLLDATWQRRWRDSLRPTDPARPDGQQYGYGIAQARFGSVRLFFHNGDLRGSTRSRRTTRRTA